MPNPNRSDFASYNGGSSVQFILTDHEAGQSTIQQLKAPEASKYLDQMLIDVQSNAFSPSTNLSAVSTVKATERDASELVAANMQKAINEFQSGKAVDGAPSSKVATFSPDKLQELQDSKNLS